MDKWGPLSRSGSLINASFLGAVVVVSIFLALTRDPAIWSFALPAVGIEAAFVVVAVWVRRRPS